MNGSMTDRAAQQHVTILTALYIGFSAVFAMIGILVLLVLPTIGFYSTDADAPILIAAGIGVGVLLLLFSVVGIVAGVGLLRRRPWARLLGMILAAVYLLNVPIGTLLGIYAFWVLIQDATERLFEPRPPGPAA